METTSLPPLYDPESVQPMRDELASVGFEELRTPEQVDAFVEATEGKTGFIVLNSVCGCAAGSARPGAAAALQGEIIPDGLGTVFAGMDRDAVNRLREKHLAEFTPSSPCMAIFKDKKPVVMVHRHHIEGKGPEELAGALTQVFKENCSAAGPSVSPEHYANVEHARTCGSKIPKYEG